MICPFCEQWNPDHAERCVFCENAFRIGKDRTSHGEAKYVVKSSVDVLKVSPDDVPRERTISLPRIPLPRKVVEFLVTGFIVLIFLWLSGRFGC